MKYVRIQGMAIAFAGAVTMWACSGGGYAASPTAPTATAAAPAPAPAPTPTTPSTPAGTVSVIIASSAGNNAFVPNPVRANTGDTVTFRNSDSTLHHLVMDDGSADLGAIAPGTTSAGFVLRSSTASRFHCTLHPSMVGSINGATAPETPPCVPDIYGSGC